jgi:RNA polymerase primary sigma factor
MATKIKVSPQNEEMPKKECPETPLLDLSDAAVKDLIRSAKKRGYVTYDQINALLSSQEVKSEQIEDILAKFSEMGVNVVDTKEAELEEEVERAANSAVSAWRSHGGWPRQGGGADRRYACGQGRRHGQRHHHPSR